MQQLEWESAGRLMDAPRESEALLEALDGVAYVTDADGKICAIGRRGWDGFASSNDWPDGKSDGQIGRNLFDTFSHAEVREAARELHRRVITGARTRVSYPYRCDAPDKKRHMRMAVAPVRENGRTWVLYQSTLLSETDRPWITLFDPKATAEYLAAQRSLPVVKLCSYCQKVAWPDERGPSLWIEPEEYYVRGGASQVLVSHGICPTCLSTLDG